jgi:hypothetical protein
MLSVVWALAPLYLGLLSAPCFALMAWRRRDKALAIEAACYLAATIAFVVLAPEHGSVGSVGIAIDVALIAAATVRALFVRRRVFLLKPAVSQPHPMVVVTGDWSPVFPADLIGPRDPSRPATWISEFACTGRDNHPLSLPIIRFLPTAIGGGILLAVGIVTHSVATSVGPAIGLILTPLFVAMFARRVEGSTLHYRWWGFPRSRSLLQVAHVDTFQGRDTTATVMLCDPGHTNPFRLALRSPGFALPQSTRDHLYGWLHRPGVAISPWADALLRTGVPMDPGSSSGSQRRVLIVSGWVIGPLLSFAVSAVLIVGAFAPQLAIPGAPGYFTGTGPVGKPFPIGHPWGPRCEPLLFEVVGSAPNSVYAQVATVVAEGRRDGLNIASNNEISSGGPTSLRYPPGVNPSTVPVIEVISNSTMLEHLANGDLEHIDLGWNADVDPNGRNEDLTAVQGTLFLRAIGGNTFVERRALRMLVALAEGVATTTVADSGIRDGATLDSFSASDVHAMKVMSGCSGP